MLRNIFIQQKETQNNKKVISILKYMPDGIIISDEENFDFINE